MASRGFVLILTLGLISLPRQIHAGDQSADLTRQCALFFNQVHFPELDQIEPLDSAAYRYPERMTREIGVLREAHHPRVQQIIERMRKYGGEIRILESTDLETGSIRKGGSFFKYDMKKHLPYIGLNGLASLAELEHEATHFEDWANAYEFFKPGIKDPHELEMRIENVRGSPQFKHMTETHATRKELQIRVQASVAEGNARVHSPEIPSSALPAVNLTSFIRLSTYPDTEAILRLASKGLGRLDEEERKLARKYMDSALRKAYLLRRKAHRRATSRIEELGQAHPESGKLLEFAINQTDFGTVFDDILARQLPRFEQIGEAENLRRLFDERAKVFLERLKKAEEEQSRRVNPEKPVN